MTSRTRYIAMETLISVAINAALSIGFVFLVFHGQQEIYAGGRHGMIADMAPQTFMITLMACLVPALLARKRHTTGKLDWHGPSTSASVSKILVRALLVAALTTCFVVAISEAILPRLFAGGLSFGPFLLGKATFGMILAAIVTPWTIVKVLCQKAFHAS
jgi:hypothetical protein